MFMDENWFWEIEEIFILIFWFIIFWWVTFEKRIYLLFKFIPCVSDASFFQVLQVTADFSDYRNATATETSTDGHTWWRGSWPGSGHVRVILPVRKIFPLTVSPISRLKNQFLRNCPESSPRHRCRPFSGSTPPAILRSPFRWTTRSSPVIPGHFHK